MKKNIILTFDYEIFFGKKSGTVDGSIIKPVNLLLDILQKYNVNATFFIDTTFLYRIENENQLTKQDFDAVIKQLKEMLLLGHKLELHLHPHWLDAEFNLISGYWYFPHYDNYTFVNLNDDIISNMVDYGCSLLNRLGEEFNHKVTCYRAGGWSVEPFQKLAKHLQRNNVFIDSSVMPGLKSKSSTHSFDYTSHPKKEYYRFNDTTSVEVNDGFFIEIQITSLRVNYFKKSFFVFYKKFFRNDFKLFGDGEGISINGGLFSKIIRLFQNRVEYFTLDGGIPSRFLLNHLDILQNNTIVFVSHPKTLSINSMRIIEVLALSGQFSFITLHDFYDRYIKHE